MTVDGDEGKTRKLDRQNAVAADADAADDAAAVEMHEIVGKIEEGTSFAEESEDVKEAVIESDCCRC